MNIAIFTDVYPPFINGVSTSAFTLVKTLRDHGNNVTVVTPRHDKGKMECIGDDIYLSGKELKWMYGYRFGPIFSRKVMKILKERKIEVIHQETELAMGAFARVAAKVLHVPIVYTYHTSYVDYTYYVTHGFMDKTAKRIVKIFSRTLADKSSEFITPSIKTKGFIRDIGYDQYVNVIPTGIDFSRFDKSHYNNQDFIDFRKKHEIDLDTKIILILGRIAKEKSMDFSIKGYASFKKRHPEIKTKLIIVGGGPQKEELELLTHELRISGDAIFTGPVDKDKVGFYYRLSDVYTSASLTETQGLTFMEAMASESVVLARYDTNLVGTIIDKYNGFFFNNEEEYVSLLYEILTDKKGSLNAIRTNAINSLDNYSLETFYQKSMEAYLRAKRKYW